ncbi:MAG: 4Fe-4S dicluster domain-containing protein [Anaerolineaceae bacterium]|nr:4Fe-4S dicluster domain-containing protein [Anaerolineaceae bacterium]
MLDFNFIEQVNTLSDQTIQLCYHCHKCTAGCPVADQMQFGPDRIIRMVQFGEKEKLLKSGDIWVCVACETCGARCPNEINAARILGALREIAYTEHVAVAEPGAVKFHKLFLLLVQNMGRMHEVSLLALHKLWIMNLFSDLPAGARLFMMGKVPLKPHMIKKQNEVKRIYDAVDPKKKQASHGN